MNPAGFLADMESGSRILAHALPETRLAAFTQFSREGIRWHEVGGLPKAQVIDGLRRIGIEAGLGESQVQDALAVAVENPFEPSTRRWSPHEVKVPLPDWRSRCTTAAMLQSQTFPPVSYVVPGLLPEGLTLLAGKPKIGKSWLALDVCLAVAGGRGCLGYPPPAVGDVLYVALEDNPRRLQRRIAKLWRNGPAPARLTLATDWPRLDKGGVEDISEWAASMPASRLIVLDTFAGIRPTRATTGYADDYEALAPLHRFANDRGIAVLVLHHLRKMAADDPVDTVSGTLGLTGCADTVLVLARSSQGTTLYCRGRDIEEAEQAVQFDTDGCSWKLLGHADDVHRSEQRQWVFSALADGEMEMVELIAATGMPRNNLGKLLHMMVRDGEIRRIRRGVYGPAEPR